MLELAYDLGPGNCKQGGIVLGNSRDLEILPSATHEGSSLLTMFQILRLGSWLVGIRDGVAFAD